MASLLSPPINIIEVSNIPGVVMTLSRAELRSWLKLVRGVVGLLDALDRRLRIEAGISHDDYLILSRLHREPHRTLRMSDLAREIGHSPSRLSHAVSRLEAEGWVERSRGGRDRRVVEARLTTEGVARVGEASAAHFDQIKELVFETLGAERARETANALDQIRRAAGG
jgi:DNA-binding MarR family transcriptional regulator